MKSKIIFMLIVLLNIICANAATQLDSAATAYEKGEYLKCIEIYEKVSEEEGTSSSLLANMGNAYVKAGDYGKAMLCYERSLRLDPSNKEVKENIKYITSKIEDNNKADAKGNKISVLPEDKSFFSNLKDYIVHDHSSNTWALWAGIMFVLTCACVALYIFFDDVLVRKIGFFGGMVAVGICVITLIFALMGAKAYDNHDEGVIVAYKVSLHDEPYITSKVNQHPLNRGTKMDILSIEENDKGEIEWYKVRLNSDYVGWINKADFEPI